MEIHVSNIRIIFFFFLIIGVVFIMGESDTEIEDDSVSPMEKKEKEALYSAIQGFVGMGWNGSDLYPDPCGWTPIQGVSCDLFDNGFWYVTALSIGSVYENSLNCSSNASFTRHVFQLHHLKSLSFFSCFLRDHKTLVTIPTSGWYNLRDTLQTLEFRSNPSLTGPIPDEVIHLKNLQSLVLIENGLTGGLPFNLGDLIQLRRFILTGNGFVGPIPVSLGGLSELLIIDLNSNFLSGPLPSTFGGLTSLLKLDLSNNLLEGVLPCEIRLLKNLTLLDLGNNKFTGGLTRSLQELASLEELVLSSNPMGGDLMNIQFESFQNMKYLDLSNMGLKGKIPESLTKIRKLRFLGLNNNSLCGNVPRWIEDMPSISSLHLDGNNFEGELGFSKQFYIKMGTRFRASKNPNLCCGLELTGRHVLVGVKVCEKGNNSYNKESNKKTRNALLNQKLSFEQTAPDEMAAESSNAALVVSLGSLSHGFDGFQSVVAVVGEIALVLLWDVFI